MQRKTVKGFKILAKGSKTRFEDGPALVSADVDRCSGKRWWSKEKVSILFATDEPERLLYLRAIQGHSGRAHSGNAHIDPVLQDNVLLPITFTKYECHVGHGNELRSIVHNGLTPGGLSTETGRYAVFFTVVDPMDDNQAYGRRSAICHKQESRLKNLGKHLQIQYFGAILSPAQVRGLRFYQTKSNAVVLHDTLPAEFIEKAVRMKTGEQLYHRDSERPRVALEENFAM